MKKIIFSLVAVALVAGFLAPIPGAESKLKAYYGGDAISYNGQIIVGTTSTGALELYKLQDDNNLVRFVRFRTVDPRFGTQIDFSNMMFKNESGKLFVYAVEPRKIYKYDVSDLKTLKLVAEATDNSWDWYAGLDDINGSVATIGYKGVKIWNRSLQIVNVFDVKNTDYQYNITSAQSDKFIFNINKGVVKVYDTESRQFVKQFDIKSEWENRSYNHQIYNDKVDGSIYMADDAAVKKLNINGEIEKSFHYTGPFGYDVTPSYDARYIYFSNGIGVVKLRKSDMSVVSYLYTQGLANTGGWAMGIKAVKDSEGEKLVVFNNSNIIVLDSDLKPLPHKDFGIAFVQSTEEDNSPDIIEPLFLKIDKNRAPVGGKVILSGGGFSKNEALRVELAGAAFDAEAGLDGRFSQLITIPNLPKQKADFKVIGLNSGVKYNLGFEIE